MHCERHGSARAAGVKRAALRERHDGVVRVWAEAADGERRFGLDVVVINARGWRRRSGPPMASARVKIWQDVRFLPFPEDEAVSGSGSPNLSGVAVRPAGAGAA